MGLNRCWWAKDLIFSVFLAFLCLEGFSDGSEISVNFLNAPLPLSRFDYATFGFEVLVGAQGSICSNCSINCRLDDHIPSNCQAGNVSYAYLQDGNHSVEVCANGSVGVGCASYNWTIDSVPPTAHVAGSTSFTGATNVSVNITFSEPCIGGGGFSCSSVNACNLLVYGAGQVIPSTFNILQPNLKFALLVSLSSSVQYGRVVLVMDKGFCTDSAGNKFTRTSNSSFFVHFDRRRAFVDLRTRIPEKLLQLHGETRTVQATNRFEKLKVDLYFSEPVLNSSAEILDSLRISQGFLRPTSLTSLGNRRFGFVVENLSSIAIVTVSLDSNSIISRQGTAVSPVKPCTFLYDSLRPAVRLSTTSNKKTREHSIPLLIKFMKPVFGFNSSHISLSGGHLQNFSKVGPNMYAAEIQTDDGVLSVSVPENITGDVAGNKNLASNILQLRHYSVPVVSSVLSIFATTSIVGTSLTAGLLTVSTASLQSFGAFSRSSTLRATDPGRNLFRTICHVQVFALSRWLAVNLPVEYYEFARGLQWTIPYFSLPWETTHIRPIIPGAGSPFFSGSTIFSSRDSRIFRSKPPDQDNLEMAASLYGLPLTPAEYELCFESQNTKPEAKNIMDRKTAKGWGDFNRIMFWLAVVSGGLILLHALFLLILKFKTKDSEKRSGYGALALPRFEIFLLILALPCLCEASAALLKGGAPSGIAVGTLLLGAVSLLMLGLFLFLSIGITFGKLLHYKEVHQENLKFHWYHEFVRVTLGPGKRGQWTWKGHPSSVCLVMFGPLFEDLRGPPKYMLSQISWGSSFEPGEQIITSDDETEDAEAPIIQKVFGILRIYYTLLVSVKRVCLGIMAGTHLRVETSKNPTIALLSITSFQLFFLVLKKPFIKKRVQLLEIISVATEMGIFATCLVLLRREFSTGDETKVGIFMLLLFLVGFTAQMVNILYSLYRQIKWLDPVRNSFFSGMKTASFGLLLLLVPQKMIKNPECRFPEDLHVDSGRGVGPRSGPRNDVLPSESCKVSGIRSSGSTDKPRMKQLRELARASFSKRDPSGSSKSETSTRTSRHKGLYSDLEAIFTSRDNF